MFVLQCRCLKSEVSKMRVWFPIWETADGADCADYLRQNVETDTREGVEYRMIFVLEKV